MILRGDPNTVGCTMSGMADEWELDPETASKFTKYRRALKAARDLKPEIRDAALDLLRRGASTEWLAEQTGETAEVYRRLARAHDIEPPAAYKSRAEKAKRRAAGEQDAG